jgi:PIN domain nuclease of toxin-antitoxin system
MNFRLTRSGSSPEWRQAKYLPRQRKAQGFSSLAVDEGAMTFLTALPHIHRDPFDRLLIAQAQQHQLTLATVDEAIFAYGVPTFPTAG